MIDAIVYNSNTGFTKQYACEFAVKAKLPIYSIKEIKNIKKGSNIIYFSWILGSNICKLDKLSDYNINMVCAVGMAPYSIELVEDLKQKNSITNLFYLQGGLRMHKLNLMHKMMIKMVKATFNKKLKNNEITNEEKQILDIMNNGKDNIDLDSLEPLINWFNESNQDLVC